MKGTQNHGPYQRGEAHRRLILDFIEACDHTPTIREISAALPGLGTYQNVHAHVKVLRSRGDFPVTRKPTKKQSVAFEAIMSVIQRSEIPPTLAELGDATGLGAHTVRHHLLALESRGYIRRVPTAFRNIIFLKPWDNQS